jgi:hypothetical protein
MSGSTFTVTHHAFSSGTGGTTDGDGSHGSTSKTPSYTKSVSWHITQFPVSLVWKAIPIIRVVGSLIIITGNRAAMESLMTHVAHAQAKLQSSQWISGYQTIIAEIESSHNMNLSHPLASHPQPYCGGKRPDSRIKRLTCPPLAQSGHYYLLYSLVVS